MKDVEIGSKKYSIVQVADEPGEGGACHEYCVSPATAYCVSPATASLDVFAGEFASVRFQKGPVRENGINGCHHEDLIAIVIHRLQSFQAGEYSCRENALALTKLEEAMHWLNHRTQARVDRGVEGTSVK